MCNINIFLKSIKSDIELLFFPGNELHQEFEMKQGLYQLCILYLKLQYKSGDSNIGTKRYNSLKLYVL